MMTPGTVIVLFAYFFNHVFKYWIVQRFVLKSLKAI